MPLLKGFGTALSTSVPTAPLACREPLRCSLNKFRSSFPSFLFYLSFTINRELGLGNGTRRNKTPRDRGMERGGGAPTRRPAGPGNSASRLPAPSCQVHRPQRSYARPPARTSRVLLHSRGHLTQELLHDSGQREPSQGGGHGVINCGFLGEPRRRDASTGKRPGKIPAAGRGRGEAQ